MAESLKWSCSPEHCRHGVVGCRSAAGTPIVGGNLMKEIVESEEMFACYNSGSSYLKIINGYKVQAEMPKGGGDQIRHYSAGRPGVNFSE